MPLLIPTNPIAAQTLTTNVGGQTTQLNIRQQARGLFMDVLVDDALIIGGVICQNLNTIVRDAYLGFSGDFAWWDTQGTDDPVYTGLGGRWQLWYWTSNELAGLVL